MPLCFFLLSYHHLLLLFFFNRTLPCAHHHQPAQLSRLPSSPNKRCFSHRSNANDDWWYRRNRQEYVPALEKGNASVQEFLKNFNLQKSCQESDGIKEGTLEHWLLKLRDNNGIWSPIIFVFFAAAVTNLDRMNLIPKSWMRSRRAHRWEAGRDRQQQEKQDRKKKD